MLSDEQNRLIAEIEALQVQIENRFMDQYPVIFKDLYKDVLAVIADVRFSGSADTRAKQLLELVKLKNRIAEVVKTNPEYKAAVKEVQDGMIELRNLTDDYFRTVIDGHKPEKELYEAVLRANLDSTKDLLIGQGVQDLFAQEIVSVIRNNLSDKTKKQSVEESLKVLIEGTKDQKALLEGRLRINAQDSVMMFNRQYINTVSADLNISYFIYSGTAIKTSRSFCASRAGKIYPKKEIEGWAKLTWNGKKPGTNEKTIFEFAGGWNCSHTLYPATKAQFLIQQKALKAKSS